ncbi:MAG: SprB repeat-containing protein, partial [Aureispira sp.]
TPTITPLGATILCSGDSVDLDAGAFAGYIWSTGELSRTIRVGATDAYSVTVNDAGGCVGSDTITVTVGTPLTVNLAIQDLSCNNMVTPDGRLVATALGSFGSYAYTWSTLGSTTDTLRGLSPGSYCVTVTDAQGCTADTCATISEPTAITFTTAQTDVTCFGGSDGTATITAVGGTGILSYLWSNTQTTATATGLPAGNVCVTVTDVNGCSVDTCLTIIQPTMTVTAAASIATTYTGGTNVSCNGACDGIASVVAMGGSPAVSGYVYSWSTSPVQTRDSAFALCAGTVIVTVTDSLGCSAIDSVRLSEPSAITVTAVSVSTRCNTSSDGSASAMATGGAGGYSYAWSTTPVQITDTARGLAAGNYIITVTDANGCTGSTSVSVSEPSAVSVTTSLAAAISCNGTCDGAAAAIGAGGTGPYTYLWSNGQGTDTATTLCVGVFGVTVSDANGCTNT